MEKVPHITFKGSNLVVKSNDLVEARYRLDTLQQVIVLMLASMIKEGDKDFKTYRLKVSDFNRVLGTKTKNRYQDIMRSTEELIGCVLKIRNGDDYVQVSWLSSAKYRRGKGYVDLCFDPRLKAHLLGLKESFTRYRLQNVVNLHRPYDIRLYELLKQYENSRSRRRRFGLDDLRMLLGISGDEYRKYSHLKNKVLLPAQRELMDKTDIAFSLHEIKEARSVVEVEFSICRKARLPIQMAERPQPAAIMAGSGLPVSDIARIGQKLKERAEMEQAYQRLPGTEKERLEREFARMYEAGPDSMEANFYRREGLKNTLVLIRFHEFLRERLPQGNEGIPG